MEKTLRWFDHARDNFDTREVFATTPAKERLIDQWFFGIRAKAMGSMGIYVELYDEQPGGGVSAFTLTFCAPYDQVRVDSAAENATFDIDDTISKHVVMATPRFDGGGIYKAWLEFDLKKCADSKTRPTAVSARLMKDHEQAKVCKCFDLNMPTAQWSDETRSVITKGLLFQKTEKNAKAFCPNCSGNGSTISMHIPKADRESGATGYALFSCNQISGREACRACDGTGARYLPWWLSEHPELSNLRFQEGSGLQREKGGLI